MAGEGGAGWKPMREESFFRDYDRLALGQILAQALDGGAQGRQRILEKEQEGRNRTELVAILSMDWTR